METTDAGLKIFHTTMECCHESFLNRQEYVSELFHYLHSSTDSPQLLALLESFLFSVVRDVKHYASENQRLEEALKRFVIPCLLSLTLITIIYSSHQSSLV